MAKSEKKVDNGKTPENRIANVVPTTVFIHPLRNKRVTFRLVGTSPLVVHNFGIKARTEMLESQTGKRTAAAREKRCPEQEYLDAFHWVDSQPPAPDKIEDGVPFYDEKRIKKIIAESRFGIPLTAFKNAIVSAARNTDLAMARLRQQLFVASPEHHEFAIISGDPEMHSTIVRIGQKKPMERFRPMFREWETTITVEFDANVLNESVVANLVSIAGFYVGVLEGRPEKCALGWGRWSIAG